MPRCLCSGARRYRDRECGERPRFARRRHRPRPDGVTLPHPGLRLVQDERSSHLTVQYAKALPTMRVNVVDPGYTATDPMSNTAPSPSPRLRTRSCASPRSAPTARRRLLRPAGPCLGDAVRSPVPVTATGFLSQRRLSRAKITAGLALTGATPLEFEPLARGDKIAQLRVAVVARVEVGALLRDDGAHVGQ